MGLFKTKSKAQDESYETPEALDKKHKKKGFAIFKGKGDRGAAASTKPGNTTSSPSNQTLKTLELTTETPPPKTKCQPAPQTLIDESGFPIEDVDLPADIPKTISAWAPNGVLSDLGLEDQRCDDDMTRDGQDDADSLGSPISKFQKSQMIQAHTTESNFPLDPVDSTREPPGVDIHNPPSIRYLSYYITSLSAESSPDPSSEPPSRALRSLFSLSEHASSHKDRVAMVQWKSQNEGDPSSLVPALLDFLSRCKRDTSEQYLAMLVLNNISIPHENKRCIALDYGGVKTLGRLLCQDPGCHLLVIILVNLTFCEANVRRDLFTKEADAHLVEALAYTLFLASLSNEQLATLPPIPLADKDGNANSPKQLLSILTTNLEDLGLHPSIQYGPDVDAPSLTFDDGAFSETARWSLCALKNLTRPDKLAPFKSVSGDNRDAVAALSLLDAGVVPLLLRIVRFHVDSVAFKQDPQEVGIGGEEAQSTPFWSMNSAQDAALYALMHLASVPEVRHTLMNDYGCSYELSKIVASGKSNEKLDALIVELDANDPDADNVAQLGLQSMKARIALSYMNERQYGEPKRDGGDDFEASIVAKHETFLFTELLSNCLHSRPKDGSAGGYSSSTFSLKGSLYSIRSILMERKNRFVFASTKGARLNALLLKTLAQYSFGDKDGVITTVLDAEAAEHAVFSLYLMSSYGFHEAVSRTSIDQFVFLPAQFGDVSDAKHRIDSRKVLTGVLSRYMNMDDTSSAGRHAALQLLLRSKCLAYSGTVLDLMYLESRWCESDFDLDQQLLDRINEAIVERKLEGVPPSADIFNRAIVRYQTNASGICVDSHTYLNAMDAVEEMSFGSTTTSHSGNIDEIAIANNIVNAADGLTSMAYGYAWRWEDEEADVRVHSLDDQALLDDVSETERSMPYMPRRRIFGRLRFSDTNDEDNSEPFSIFGFRCGAPLCGR